MMDLVDFPGPMARIVQETNPPKDQFWGCLVEITKAFAESSGNEGWQGGPQEVDEPGTRDGKDASDFLLGRYLHKNWLDVFFAQHFWNCEL